MLVSTAFGVGFVALVTRRPEAHARPGSLRDVAGEAFARVQAAEQRAAAAEQRAHEAEHELARRAASEAAAFRAVARPGMSAWLVSAISAALIGGAAAALFFGAYRPLMARLAAERASAAQAGRSHAVEVEALRRLAAADAAKLQAQLAAERARAAQAVAAEQVAKDTFARAAAPAAEPVAAPVTAPAVALKAKPARSRAHAKPKRASRAPRTSKRIATPVAAADDAPTFDRETRRALRDHVSDDPIEGL